MPSLSEHDDDPEPIRSNRRLIAPIVVIVVVIFALLHLTGVLGPGSH